MHIEIKTIQKKISDAKVGEYVKAYDIGSDSDCYRQITAVHDPVVEKRNQLKVLCANGSEVSTSKIHPILVQDENEKWCYRNTSEIRIGDILLTNDGSSMVSSISMADKSVFFKDLTVDRTNNYYAGSTKHRMIVCHNSATLYVPIWHLEIEDILVLKNNKGTEDNRVRHMDYGIQFSKLFYERLITGGVITLFSPHDVPEMYEAFFSDQARFKELYEAAEKDPLIRKKTVKAIELFSAFAQERKDTGRIYLMNVDNANTHSSFDEKVSPVRMSNLCCVSGETMITVMMPSGDLEDIKIIDVPSYIDNGLKVLSRNIKTGKDEFRKVLAFAKTRENAQVMRITDEDKGSSLICTPDHLIYTSNRGYVRADELDPSDVIKSL